MASVFRRTGRSKWYAKLRVEQTGEWKSVVTPFRLNDVAGKRKALVWAAEQDRIGEAVGASAGDRWEWWVVDWLTFKYEGQENTLRLYRRGWAIVFMFLLERDLQSPRQVTRQHAQQFMVWRMSHKRSGGKPITRSTANNEFSLFRLVMTEAVNRGIISFNPLLQAGVVRKSGKEKPEILKHEHWRIVRGLRELPESKRWMRISYHIATRQGCRRAETSIDLADVDLERGTLTLRAKGSKGQKHVFTTALHPSLKHLVRWVIKQGQRRTCEIPPVAGPDWTRFFRKIGLPHLCFHCTRVTVITKLARAGIPEQKAIRFIGHADHTVHRIYQRLVPADVADVASVVRF